MDSTVPPENPKSTPNKRSRNVLHIGGIPVEFPYQPYGSQLALMGRVIATLDRAQRDGHCHALLESPTGTGKSLSLLCSALAWQQNHRSKNLHANLSHSKADPEALIDPLARGGGFIPEVELSGNLGPASSSATSKNQKKKMTPTIFYASRTHSQITQVIREYKKTSYRVTMAVLASRKHYCTNTYLRGNDNIDEQCKLLLKNQETGCSEFKNVHKVKGHPSLQKGGCHEVHDIEDLVNVGQVVRGCSYFAARSMADDALLVFCPYSYIVNPVIRKAMEVDIEGAIVIFDEAHNIEDISREAGSVDVEEDVLYQLQMELGQLSQNDAMTYQPLHEMIEGILCWIGRRKNTLEKHEFRHYFSGWTGDRALRELQDANISQQCFPIMLECAKKALKAASDADPEVAHLGGMSATTLAGLVSSLNYFFSGNGLHIYDYQLVLQRYIKRTAGNAAGSWTNTMSLWCLNPAVVFRDIADLSLSVILTSGTLSPLNSFTSELGIHFGTSLEAPHVIDVESQLWAAVISSGPGNYPLNASYKTADGYTFQDSLGTSLEEICKVVPGGCLVFFPSYKLMEKLCSRWRETGQWSRLNACKSLFIEPKGGSQDDFEPVLKGYYNALCKGNKPVIGKKKRGNSKQEGAAFLAVCRGKVSEGIDFSDDYARVVIIVGIPFPNINDIQVTTKKKYNDTFKSSKNLLSGSDWYCHQAFRALNQAAGRCIRHRFDYGAIVLLDERFCEERNTQHLSKWLRKSIRQFNTFEKSLDELKSFFSKVKEQVSKTTCIPPYTGNDAGAVSSMDQSKVFTRHKNQKLNKSNSCGSKVGSEAVQMTEQTPWLWPSPPFLTKNGFCSSPEKIQELNLAQHKVNSSCEKYTGLECDNEMAIRTSWPALTALSSDERESSAVKETPYINDSIPVSTPESFARTEYCSSTTKQNPDLSSCPLSITKQCIMNSKSMCSLVVTPPKNVIPSLLPDIEASLSVNSHVQKRRSFLGSSEVEHLQTKISDTPDFRTQCVVGSAEDLATEDIGCGVESVCDVNHSDKVTSSAFELLTSSFDGSFVTPGLVLNQKLQISCSLCKSPLGLPGKNLYSACSVITSSKIHLASLWKKILKPRALDTSSLPVVVCDISSVHRLLYNRTSESETENGIWCKDDGCVFNVIFCPFCSIPNNCLGVLVMATDASNTQLLNKILFYLDRVVTKNLESSNAQDFSPSKCISKNAILNSIEKFSYSPQHDLGGWRTTKSKMPLPRRNLLSSSEDP